MSISIIIGDTSNDIDARKVPWANIVCNSLYALNLKIKNVDAIDGNINHLTVQTLNGFPYPLPPSQSLVLDDFTTSSAIGVAFITGTGNSASQLQMFTANTLICAIAIAGVVAANQALVQYNIAPINPSLTDVSGVLSFTYRSTLAPGIIPQKWSCFQVGNYSQPANVLAKRPVPNFLINADTNISRVYKFYFPNGYTLAADGTTVTSNYTSYAEDFYTQFSISNLSTIQRDFTLDINGKPYKSDMDYSIQFILYKTGGVSQCSLAIVNNLVLTSLEDITIPALLTNNIYYAKLEIVDSNINISFFDNTTLVFTRSYNINVLDNTLTYGFIHAMSSFNVSDTEFTVSLINFDYISTNVTRNLLI